MIYSRFKFKKNRTMKAIIIYVSTYQSNTLKVAQRMANELSAFLAGKQKISTYQIMT